MDKKARDAWLAIRVEEWRAEQEAAKLVYLSFLFLSYLSFTFFPLLLCLDTYLVQRIEQDTANKAVCLSFLFLSFLSLPFICIDDVQCIGE